jgi:hypothetical protein
MNNERQFIELPNEIITNIALALNDRDLLALSQVNKQLYDLIMHLLAKARNFRDRFPHLPLVKQISLIEQQIHAAVQNYQPISKRSEAALITRLPIERSKLIADIKQSIKMLGSQFKIATHNNPRNSELQELYNLQRDIYMNYTEGHIRFGKIDPRAFLLLITGLCLLTLSIFGMTLIFQEISPSEPTLSHTYIFCDIICLLIMGIIFLVSISELIVGTCLILDDRPDDKYFSKPIISKQLTNLTYNHSQTVHILHSEIYRACELRDDPLKIIDLLDIAHKVISNICNSRVVASCQRATHTNYQLQLLLANLTRFQQDCDKLIHPSDNKLRNLLFRLNRLAVIIDNNLSRLKP